MSWQTGREFRPRLGAAIADRAHRRSRWKPAACANCAWNCSWGICSRSMKKSAIIPRASRACCSMNFSRVPQRNSARARLANCSAENGDCGAGEHEPGVGFCVQRRDSGRSIGICMAVGACGMPEVLFGTECCDGNFPQELPRTALVAVRELNANGMLVGRIFVHNKYRPFCVRPRDSVGGDQVVACIVLKVRCGGIETMNSRAMLYPIQIDHAACEILRCVLFDIQFLIRDEVSIGAVTAAARTQRFRLNW